MSKILQISICFFLSIPLYAQYTYLGADAYARANTLVAVPTYSSIYHNPAGIGLNTGSFVAINYFKTLPIEGLHTVGAIGVYKNNILNFGASADSFGDKYYRESRVGVAVSKKLDKVSIGLKMSYMGVHIDDYSSRNSLLGEIGMLVIPNRFFSMGLHLVNFTNAKLYGEENLPTLIAFGVGINPNQKVNISTQVDYVLNQKPVVRFGINYQIRNELGLSAGVNPELEAVHFGTNFMIKKYGFYYAVATHPNVGLAHNLSLIFKLNE